MRSRYSVTACDQDLRERGELIGGEVVRRERQRPSSAPLALCLLLRLLLPPERERKRDEKERDGKKHKKKKRMRWNKKKISALSAAGCEASASSSSLLTAGTKSSEAEGSGLKVCRESVNRWFPTCVMYGSGESGFVETASSAPSCARKLSSTYADTRKRIEVFGQGEAREHQHRYAERALAIDLAVQAFW